MERPGDDLGCTLARAWQEGGNDSYALIRARVGSPGSLSTEQPSDDGAEELARGAAAVVERGRQALRGQRCVVNWAHADHSEPQDPKPVVSREEFAPVITLVVAERIDLGRHLIV